MSADNIATCPRCTRRHEKDVRDSDERVKAAYGTVPLDEWMKMQADHDVLANESMHQTFRTFREDYEITGVEDGEIEVEYRGRCNVCDLRVSFTDTHPVEGVED